MARLFKRGPSDPEPAGNFWSWWQGGRDRVANAIATGGFDERLINDVSRAVQAIHPAMAWELAPGLPPRRLKINFEQDMDWSFQRDLGIR